MGMKRILAALLLLTLAAPASGQDFEKGLRAYEQRDYATALSEWRPLAEQGNIDAQYRLGMAYAGGHGVPQDYAKAAKWHQKAAEQGQARAQTFLGGLYHYGRGVPQDYAEAVKWYRKAAEQGRARAQALLGNMYAEGKSVPQDFVLAHKWLNLAVSDAENRNVTVKMRDIIAKLMTPDQIAEAQRLAREWMAAFEKRKKK